MSESKGDIYKLVPLVMRDIGAIGKDQMNQFDKYHFRGIDDVYNAVQPALVRHGLFFVPVLENTSVDLVQTSQGKPAYRALVQMTFTLCAPDGSSVVCRMVGEAMDRGDKACNKAMSAAYKYAMFQLFCIPTEGDNDSENQTHEIAPPRQSPKPQPKPDIDMAGLRSDKGVAFVRAQYKTAQDAIRGLAATKTVTLEAEAFLRELYETEAVLQ